MQLHLQCSATNSYFEIQGVLLFWSFTVYRAPIVIALILHEQHHITFVLVLCWVMRHRALRWRNISGQLQAGKMHRANWLPLILPLSSVLASFTALLLPPLPLYVKNIRMSSLFIWMPILPICEQSLE